VGKHYILKLVPICPVSLLKDVLLEEYVSDIYLHIVPIDVAEPTVLFVKVFINGMPILVNRHGLSTLGVAHLKVILSLQPCLSVYTLLNFPVYQICPTLHCC